MDKTKLLLTLIAVVAVGAVVLLVQKPKEPAPTTGQANVIAAVAPQNFKEFTLTSFFEMKDGKPAPQFSLKEIRVKKGDAVRLKVTNTKGMHDFVIDEYGIAKETPLNQEVIVEFTADMAGNFIYYCSKPNHRNLGQWGTLVVE